MNPPPPDFPSFELAAPSAYAGDPLWNVRMFRMASYLSGRARGGAARLGLHASLALADQFIRTIGAIAANIAEGYSRDSDADRRRFYGYALGSTREAIAWLDATGLHDGPANAEYVDLHVQIRRQLLATLKRIGRPESRAAHRRGSKPA